MTPYDLPTLGGLRLVKGLCEGVLLGKDAIAGFPSLHNLPHYGTLSFHGITIYQTASRKETIVVHIENLFETLKVEDIARSLIGNRVYIDYPFLREAKVVGVSDSLFRYELDTKTSQLCPTPHTDAKLASYKRTVDHLEYNYSKKCGLITGEIEVLLHVKPIKSLTRAEDGALIKEYEEREIEHALQTVVTTVSSEDPRFLVRFALMLVSWSVLMNPLFGRSGQRVPLKKNFLKIAPYFSWEPCNMVVRVVSLDMQVTVWPFELW